VILRKNSNWHKGSAGLRGQASPRRFLALQSLETLHLCSISQPANKYIAGLAAGAVDEDDFVLGVAERLR